MSSPAEIPHADEALKALVVRFKAAPGSSAFTELAAALLARGHASEALRIAEHGLQLVPDQVEGRVERAASLLALGRPRVAYVELRRALAIDPQNRRAMRLLGKAFVDAGAPSRAAALLAKRSMDPDYEPAPAPKPQTATKNAGEAWKKRPMIDSEPTKPVASPSDGAIPELFSALTRDLGLGGAVPEAPVRRVEVTQIIRRKGLLRPPRSASELAEIRGPIVDTTQPGQLMELDLDEPQEVTARAPAPLFSAATGQGLTPFALDDEPLFQEDMPFSVRPVEGGGSVDLEPTLDNDDDELDATTDQIEAHNNDASESRDTLVDHLEEGTEPVESFHAAKPPTPLALGPEADAKVRRFVAAKESKPKKRKPTPAAGEASRFDGGVPVVEKSRANAQQRLEIVDPKPAKGRVVLAAFAAAIMLAYFIGLGWFLADEMRPWFATTVAKESAPPPANVPTKTARASE